MSKRGFTLVELLVGIGIATTLILAAGKVFSDLLMMKANAERITMAQTDLPILAHELKRIYTRTERVSFFQNGAGAGGYLVYRNGAAVLRADLRQPGVFTPSNLSTPENLNEVRLLCCDQNMTMNVTPPWSTSPTSLQSACTNGPGASIEVLAPNGEVQSHLCYNQIQQMNIIQMGNDQVRGSRTSPTPFYYHSFAITGEVLRMGQAPRQVPLQFKEIYLSPAYTIDTTFNVRASEIIPSDGPFFMKN